jgi:hypothetical protein
MPLMLEDLSGLRYFLKDLAAADIICIFLSLSFPPIEVGFYS